MTRHVLRGLLLAMLMMGCATAPEPPPRAAPPGIVVADLCLAQAKCLATGQVFEGVGASAGLAQLAAVRACRAACPASAGCPLITRGCGD